MTETLEINNDRWQGVPTEDVAVGDDVEERQRVAVDPRVRVDEVDGLEQVPDVAHVDPSLSNGVQFCGRTWNYGK